MSEVGVRRMNLIVESLAGRPVYSEFTVEPNFTWGSNGAFIVIYADQDCGVCLYEMTEFTEQLSPDHELPIFAVKRTGEKQFPGDALVHLDYDAMKFNPQLRNVPTPILIYSDGSKEIKSGYVSTLFDDRDRKEIFFGVGSEDDKQISWGFRFRPSIPVRSRPREMLRGRVPHLHVLNLRLSRNLHAGYSLTAVELKDAHPVLKYKVGPASRLDRFFQPPPFQLNVSHINFVGAHLEIIVRKQPQL